MAIKQMNIVPNTELQRRYQQFWKRFNDYSAQDDTFCAEFKPHPYADVRYYQDFAVSMGPYHLCAGINFNKQEISVAAYFRDVDTWDIYFNRYKERIESQVGRQLNWKRLNTKGEAAIVRHLEIDEPKRWDSVFNQIISDLLLIKRVFSSFYNKSEMRKYWIFPYNINYYKLDNRLELYDWVIWRHNNTFEIGDIVFMYSSTPIRRLTYVMQVAQVDATEDKNDTLFRGPNYNPDRPSVSKRVMLTLQQRLSREMDLSYNDLKAHGLRGNLQSKMAVSGELLAYIQDQINREITLEASPDFLTDASTLPEGAVMQVTINKYERNRSARERCIAAHGCRCVACGIDFGQVYGEVGKGFIHVHHIVPLASIGKSYRLNPEKDLVPVCPNCHAMLHRAVNGKLLSVDQLRATLKKQ